MTKYTDAFYADQQNDSLRSARKVLAAVFPEAFPRTVLDIGCGVGPWLKACLERGADEVAGIDGDYVPRDRLMIPAEAFRAADISAPLQLGRRYDLALSLEVIEHLEPTRARQLVANLAGAADLVLCSGALPYQGGTGHVNENWHQYWTGLFAAAGLDVYDVVRPVLWDDDDVAFWYRQNTFLYATRARAAALGLGAPGPRMPLDAVHPECYLRMAALAGRGDFAVDCAQLAALRAWAARGGPPPEQARRYGPQNELRFDGWRRVARETVRALRRWRRPN